MVIIDTRVVATADIAPDSLVRSTVGSDFAFDVAAATQRPCTRWVSAARSNAPMLDQNPLHKAVRGNRNIVISVPFPFLQYGEASWGDSAIRNLRFVVPPNERKEVDSPFDHSNQGLVDSSVPEVKARGLDAHIIVVLVGHRRIGNLGEASDPAELGVLKCHLVVQRLSQALNFQRRW
jgi:hypothetical protein